MRIACVLLPRFPLAVELLARPELRGRPVVLGGAPEDRTVVVECTLQAERSGIRRGMALREALARCHDAAFLEAHPARYAEVFERMLDALEHVSPIVEGEAPGCAFIDLTGLPGTGDALGEAALAEDMAGAVKAAVQMTPLVGIADGRFAARAAAMSLIGAGTGQRFRLVTPGEARTFVASLPVDRLPLSDETLHRLHWLGLQTIGDVAALPQGALIAQFGPEGVLMSELVRGEGGGPLVPRRHAPLVADALDFPLPTVETAAILAGSRILLGRLLRRPECSGRAVRGLSLDAALSNGHRRRWALTFREPTGDRERMLRALAAKLEGEAFSAPVESLELILRDLCGEAGLQGNLFSNHAHHLRNLDTVLAQLRARFGRPLIMKVVGVEPWSRIPERQYALIPVGAERTD